MCTEYSCNGGCLPDILLLNLSDYHWGTRLPGTSYVDFLTPDIPYQTFLLISLVRSGYVHIFRIALSIV